MGIFTDIFGKALKPISDIASEIIVDKDKKRQFDYELAKAQKEMEDKASERLHDQMIAQIEVNKIEAGSSSLFVSGWRPGVGWVGVFILAFNYILYPIAAFISRLLGYTGSLPTLSEDVILYLLGGMLGFGTLRSWDKLKGVASDSSTYPVSTSKTVTTETKTVAPATPPVVPPGFGNPLPENAPWQK
jgi:hypothetical protein